ncbi:DUF6095 family protein [Psychroserpens jangbogonensis]|uniref:DUF6095 family protein n=1 Tax=Psychroserpens jangbogonensis TaxID=1484460 RepID=UPI00053EC3DB|nr:DUF6095 family protein [Psychroserpens jangbogonensis]
METKRTNKEELFKGIKTMGISLVLMFLGPSLIYVAFSNSEKPLYIPILVLAFILCILAVYFAFKGLKTIMDSMFK